MARKQMAKIDSYRERKQHVAAQYAKQYPHFNLISNFFGAAFIISMGLTIWALTVYDRTFMPLYIPIAIYLIIDLLVTPLLRKPLNIYIVNANNPGYLPLLFHVLYNIVTWGGIMFFFADVDKQNF